jgi:oligopeptide transport system substrate-binding protein
MRLTMILLATLLAAAGCAASDERPAPRPGVLTAGLPEPANLLRDRTITGAMWTPLLDFDPATGKSTPRAAESVTSDDQVTWTIKLRPGTYHDGTPVTAKSYVDAWATVSRPELLPAGQIVPVDDQTIRLVTTRPASQVTAFLASALALPVRPGGDPRQPIGNGPFRLAAPWEPGKGGRLVRVTDAPGKAKEIDLRVFADMAVAYDEVKAGSLDLAVNVPGSRHEAMNQDFGTRHAMWPQPSATFLVFGQDLTDPVARYAVAMSLDRKALAVGVGQNQVDPATSLLPPAVAPGERGTVCRACNNDPAAAKSMRAQAGLTAVTVRPADDPVAKAVAEQLKSVLGVDTGIGPGPDLLTVSLDTTSPHELFARLGIESVNQFIDAAAVSGDPEERAQMYRLAENQILRDLPVAPLWSGHGHAVWNERTRDVTASAGRGIDLPAVAVY